MLIEKKGLSQPVYTTKVEGTDILVPMRDGVRLAVDVYRPDAEGRFPALLAFAVHNKFLQSPQVAEACNNQPAWAPLWCGPAEGGGAGPRARDKIRAWPPPPISTWFVR